MYGSFASQEHISYNQGFSSSSPSKESVDFRVSHSNVSEDFRVNHTEFDFLPNYPYGTALDDILRHISFNFNSLDWLDHFSAIDNLRILGKYQTEHMNAVFEYFGPHIENSLKSPKSCITKNMLVFINESFHHAKRSGLSSSIVIFLLPKLVLKASGISKTMKPLAEAALTGMVQNCLNDDVLINLCEMSCNNPNQCLSKVSFHYLTRALEIIREDLSQIAPHTLRILFICFARVLEGPCSDNKTLCRRIIGFVKAKMGNEAYGGLVHQLFAEEAISRRQGELLFKFEDTPSKPRPSLACELQGTNARKSVANKDTLYLEINKKPYNIN